MKSLRKHLEETRMTQERFASLVGTTQANVSKLCGDNPKISPRLAARIEAATGGAVPIEAWPQFEVFASRHTKKRGNRDASRQEAAE